MGVVLGMLGGATIGGIGGFWLGCLEGGDFNFAPVMYGPIGALIGCFVGGVAGVVIG